MKVKEFVDYLDSIEQGLLFSWGCPNYETTVKRLDVLMNLAVDPMMKQKFYYLRNKLILTIGDEYYTPVYFCIRGHLQSEMVKKQELVNQIEEMKRKGNN